MNGKWQYRVVEVKPKFIGVRTADLQDELDRQGQQGWELVQVIQNGTMLMLFLKKAQ